MIPRGHFDLSFGIIIITPFERVCKEFQSKKSAPGLRTRLSVTTQIPEPGARFTGNLEILGFRFSLRFH